MEHPSNVEIQRALNPWHKCFAGIFLRAENRVLAGIQALGMPRKDERAGQFHVALRTESRTWCDETFGMFQLVEEPDGQGLDYIICYLIPGKPFAVRFGRINNGRIKRNSTRRQTDAQSCGILSSELLFDDLDRPDGSGMRQVTLAYSIENEGTEAGRPRWYMESVMLMLEHFDYAEPLSPVLKCHPPESVVDDVRRAVVTSKPEEVDRIRAEIRFARDVG